MARFSSVRARLERRVKTTLAGTDLEALVRNRDRRRLRWLCEESDDDILRLRALRSLSELVDPSSQQLFVSRVQAPAGDLPTLEICVAAQALGRLVCRQAAAPLQRLLEPSRPAAVNLSAARALASLGEPSDWQAVRRWVKRSAHDNPPFPDLRDLIQNDEPELREQQVAVLVLQVLYPEKDLRWWTGKASAWLRSSDSAPRIGSERGADKVVAQSLRHALQRERLSDPEFRHKVLLLGTLARDRDYEFLHGLLAEERLERARAVRSALSLGADPRGIEPMRRQLERARTESASELADALRCAGRYSHRELVGPISESWQAELNEDCRSNLIWALGECGGGGATAFLLGLVRDRDGQLIDSDYAGIGRSLLRSGRIGKEALRGGVTMARAGGGERQRMARLAAAMGMD